MSKKKVKMDSCLVWYEDPGANEQRKRIRPEEHAEPQRKYLKERGSETDRMALWVFLQQERPFIYIGNRLTSSSVQSARSTSTSVSTSSGKGGKGRRENGRKNGRTPPQHIRLQALDLCIQVVEQDRTPCGEVRAEFGRGVGGGFAAVAGDEELQEGCGRDGRGGRRRRRARSVVSI